jgi:type VI secretion system protein ImpK
MRQEIANLIHPVLAYGLQLKERLERSTELPDLEDEQARLKGLLTASEGKGYPDFYGERGLDGGTISGLHPGKASRLTGGEFLGARYALACWLDELFSLDSPWGFQWTERTLEEALHGTRDRAFKFWEQARRAEARPGSDALEVYYLCVMLGFRGDFRDQPEKLRAWVTATQARIAKS